MTRVVRDTAVPRIHQQLLREGYPIGKKRVERLMRELEIQAAAKKKYKATTDSIHSKPIAENHLNRDFTPDTPILPRWLISPIFGRLKTGSIWLPSWIFTPAGLSAGHSGRG